MNSASELLILRKFNMIEVQISYDPKIVGYPFLKIIYDDFGLNAPTPEEMMKHRDKIKLPSGKETEIGWESFAPLSKEKAKKLVNLLLDIYECPHRVQSPYRGSFGDQTLFDCSHPDRKAVNAQYGSCDVLDTVCPPVQNDGAEAILPEHKS